MNTNIHNQEFVITRDGEVTDEFEPSIVEQSAEMVLHGLHKVAESVALETRMFVFDALHHTHYRAIRHELIERQKREAFEKSIGLVAVGKK